MSNPYPWWNCTIIKNCKWEYKTKCVWLICSLNKYLLNSCNMSIIVLGTRDGTNNTNEIQLSSWKVRMGIVYRNRPSNTACQVVWIIRQNDRVEKGSHQLVLSKGQTRSDEHFLQAYSSEQTRVADRGHGMWGTKSTLSINYVKLPI